MKPKINKVFFDSKYQSPIKVIMDNFSKNIEYDIENEVYKVLQHYAIEVDREELLKALRYDRNQYELGFIAGLHRISGVMNGVIDLLTEMKEDFISTNEIREASAIRYAITRVENLKYEYLGGFDNDGE